MKNPFEMTLSEVSALIGDTPELLHLVNEVHDKQIRIRSYITQKTHDLIKKRRESPEMPKIYALTEAELAKLA